eukprot:gene37028-61060_t
MLSVLLSALLAESSPPLSGPVCSVASHGAVGDNATLDTAAIQATIDACHA